MLLRYQKTRSVKLRNLLVENYRGKVQQMARVLWLRLPRSVDVDDLTHAGVWGLIQAIENFRPERGTIFMAFMRIRVRGAMLDELRNMDFLPRLYRSRLRLRDEAQVRLRRSLQRDPSDDELATELGVSESRFRQQYALHLPVQSHAANNGRNQDLDRGERSDADLLASLEDTEQETPIEAIHRRELLEKIEASLQPLEWNVLRLHYLEGLSGKEVASKLHLSASRICQIHGRVLSRLKMRLSSSAN